MCAVPGTGDGGVSWHSVEAQKPLFTQTFSLSTFSGFPFIFFVLKNPGSLGEAKNKVELDKHQIHNSDYGRGQEIDLGVGKKIDFNLICHTLFFKRT